MTFESTRRRNGGSSAWLGALLLAVGLTGCNPVETYRSVSGMNKNDPDPATAPYTANLEKGESGSYPNLASVPEPPTVVTTVAERQTLTASLTGARTGLQANGGTAAPGPVPPPPPIPASIAAPQVTMLPAVVPPPQTTPTPSVARPEDEPAPPVSPTSTGQSPTIAKVPLVEASRSPLSPAHPSPMPAPAPSALPPATVQSGNPQPAPPVATLPPVPPPPRPASQPPPKLPPVPMTVASLEVQPGAAVLAEDARPHLAEVVAQYKEKPRTVRVVSYAAAATGGAEQLNSFRSALDRAQLVAKQLTDAGIPAKQIQTEAAPSSAASPAGRVEVQLLPLP